MKKIFLFLLFVSWGALAMAETVNLNDGKTIVGKVLKKDYQSVTVDVNGAAMTYYADEIKDIDGKPLIASRQSQNLIKSNAGEVVNAVSIVTVDDPIQKRELILKFIDVFGTRKVMAQNFDSMLNSLSQKNPDVALQIRERVKVDEIMERLIPLYDKHFTSQELKSYIDFYSSVIGQKLIVNIGDIMKESIEVSAIYLKEKFPEMAKEE